MYRQARSKKKDEERRSETTPAPHLAPPRKTWGITEIKKKRYTRFICRSPPLPSEESGRHLGMAVI